MRSPARSRSEPARKPERLRIFDANLTLKPKLSSTATERSMVLGFSGGLAGETIPIRPPRLSRGGLMGMAIFRMTREVAGRQKPAALLIPQWQQLGFGLSKAGFEFL